MTGREPETATIEKARTPDYGVLAIAVGLALLAGLVLWMVYTAPKVASYARIGPQAIPAVVGWCLAGLSAATAHAAFRADRVEREPIHWPPMFWIAGGLAVQMLTLKPAGFSFATGILFAAAARAFGRGPLWLTIPAGWLLGFAVYALFAKGLKLSLPAGLAERFIFQLLG